MKFRAAGIEGLRGVAAFAVVAFHVASFMLLPGTVSDDGVVLNEGAEAGLRLVSLVAALTFHGVTVFFVISGFLLYRPFVLQTRAATRTLVVREFLRNRLLRIFPGYLVIFVIAAFGFGAVVTRAGSGDEADDIGRMTDPVLAVTNLTLTHGYLPEGQLTGLGASWSLVPELAFYALLPVVWFAARCLAGRTTWVRAALLPVLAMLVIALAVRLTIVATLLDRGDGHQPLNDPTWLAVVWHSILTQGDLFALGMIVAIASVRLTAGDTPGTRANRRAWIVLSVCVVLALPTQLVLLDAPVIGAGAAAFIWLLVHGRGRTIGAARAVLESPVLNRAGLISYSVYLWHVPVILMVKKHAPDLRFDSLGSYLVALVVVAAITWALSEVTFRLVEAPALARKRSMHRSDPDDAVRVPAA